MKLFEINDFGPSPTLEQILSYPIRGNHNADSRLIDMIHRFVVNANNPMEERIQALKHLDKVMGIEGVEVTAADVEAVTAEEAGRY